MSQYVETQTEPESNARYLHNVKTKLPFPLGTSVFDSFFAPFSWTAGQFPEADVQKCQLFHDRKQQVKSSLRRSAVEGYRCTQVRCTAVVTAKEQHRIYDSSPITAKPGEARSEAARSTGRTAIHVARVSRKLPLSGFWWTCTSRIMHLRHPVAMLDHSPLLDRMSVLTLEAWSDGNELREQLSNCTWSSSDSTSFASVSQRGDVDP